MSDIKPWKTLSSEVVWEGGNLKIRKDTCLLPDGIIIPDFYVREDKDVAIIFCVTKNREVVLVRQFRQGAGGEGEITLELPAGLKDSHDHSIEDTARRELLEETGYSCEVMEQCAKWLSSVTGTAHVFVFAAEGADKIASPKHTPGEFTEVEIVPLNKLQEIASSGAIKPAIHIAAVYYMLQRLGR
ncbi:hypothetical protein A3H10_05135 [Candidatus Uhrbacteria bacterium RIFCSPLOWO2_12_FULL_46_10]|uniref:Nudix hydrolase domain-containing protein n=1 Tax=Candidatus Uhrbacteria bacterium RIFCSPLOWO2_01_FULL_47_25 TaxID=1802402 RepID=A0A1F7UT76_9BACT|nr:MAG: NTP pyrophosphohydrolase [Parcubacteria group bacterium GW2011_GWA2_46_9]OGL68310.1 MAG: hypothetical protein A3D60_05415 [Candidatus Uhrbacteria bacterium RIFCSPHIGHO2_02_FULL_47_29]OGL75221.1 MAG: hypothetical protein A3E96_03125 [Candidatus Uhrbacteria bacterium RIFCSPHIGHO2_12_FULL_46_13]OGL81465.1 MAG: hypothetical protein A2936_00075 [Candidatus Uhrbacteria bacterium RIFCSPLOWO2_01_FULL_47_25]OGL85134.1 MAG: hypothetical protein A3I37_04875 [Candidatus Uhrbacteria bacterium RIFCSP